MKKIKAFFDNKDKNKENREEVKETDNNDDDNYSSSVAHKLAFSNEYASAVAKLPTLETSGGNIRMFLSLFDFVIMPNPRFFSRQSPSSGRQDGSE